MYPVFYLLKGDCRFFLVGEDSAGTFSNPKRAEVEAVGVRRACLSQ